MSATATSLTAPIHESSDRTRVVSHEDRGNIAMNGEQLAELLAFRAAYLEAKLVKEKILSSEQEAAEYLQEVKKFLVLCESDPARGFQVRSRMIDEVWHQFVLFTFEYTKFCRRFFGRYLHHVPSNAPKREDAREAPHTEFVAAYESVFGALPAIWDDRARVGLRTRVLRRSRESLETRRQGEKVELVTRDSDEPVVVVRIDAWGEPALRFVLEEDVFFVRELPEPLLSEDKVLLVRVLLKWPALFRIAP